MSEKEWRDSKKTGDGAPPQNGTITVTLVIQALQAMQGGTFCGFGNTLGSKVTNSSCTLVPIARLPGTAFHC